MPTSRPAPIRALCDEANDSSTSAERLDELAAHPSKSVRLEVASNRRAPWPVLVRLADDPDGLIRGAAANSVGDVPEAQEVLARSSDKWVRAILAHTFARTSGSLSRSVQLTLASDDFPETRARIAETTNYLDIFEALMSDPVPSVRTGCAANPRIDREQMERLVTDRIASVRGGAIQLGCLYPDDEQMLRLARDRSKSVQWAALFREDAPLEIIQIIAAESDEFNRQQANAMLANIGSHRNARLLKWRAMERARAAPGGFDVYLA